MRGIVFSNASVQRWVVATHVYARAGVANLGLRVSDEIYDQITAWSS